MTTAASRTYRHTSADGAWGFLPPEAPDDACIAVHLPTGLEQGFTTLEKAKEWAASRNALKLLQAQALDTLRSCYAGPAEKRQALAAIEWLSR